jgi:hypothetical protein
MRFPSCVASQRQRERLVVVFAFWVPEFQVNIFCVELVWVPYWWGQKVGSAAKVDVLRLKLFW